MPTEQGQSGSKSLGAPTNGRLFQHWAQHPAERVATHTAGNGAAIVRAVQARGIGLVVAAT
jgi:hypothetical protein